eukprot:TRINITY_DN22171_c0_g1_i1.p1 TRINITY_DN22171_c0_g1~~TRINITY_DN22171_c0_g1_i1.p1  ORF type:complete len:116 (-),score=0.80 TRINITY_DN22171_c0_g1_i1:533-880(-)
MCCALKKKMAAGMSAMSKYFTYSCNPGASTSTSAIDANLETSRAVFTSTSSSCKQAASLPRPKRRTSTLSIVFRITLSTSAFDVRLGIKAESMFPEKSCCAGYSCIKSSPAHPHI